MKATNANPTAVANLTNKLEELLESKNNVIKELQYDLAKVTKVNNDNLKYNFSLNKIININVPFLHITFK